MSISSDTTSYSPQGYSTLPPSDYIPPHSDYTSPPSFGLLSFMTSVESQGGLCPSSPGRNINASVQSARAEPYSSRTPTSSRTVVQVVVHTYRGRRRRFDFYGATGWPFPDHAASRHQRVHAKPSDWTLSISHTFIPEHQVFWHTCRGGR
ncbi:hypothetical protein P692DRAFT_20901951 [Suillus brevipes Sb2]|nr:hypothetical protein P692DRAFT_20901951 [Suillus brevipes Sb2]